MYGHTIFVIRAMLVEAATNYCVEGSENMEPAWAIAGRLLHDVNAQRWHSLVALHAK
jgi:hypothetical protein